MRARLITRLMLLFVILSALAQAQVVVTDDANTSSFSPTKNFGGSIALLVGCGSNSYVKFSLANLGTGITSANVSKATLVLYTDFVLTSGTMDVYQVNGSWSEGSITYNNAPALGTKLFSAVSVTKAGFLSLDLTSTVQAWLNGTLTNNGIALVPTSGSSISVSFDSKENILTSHVADLALVLVSAGPQGQQGPQGPQGPAGPSGANGAPGPAGPTGPMGPTGPGGQQGIQGMMGLTGPTGATGPAGQQGPAGANGTGFNFRTAFDNSASYAANDVVTYNGSSYVATAATAGPNNPTPDTNTAAWSVMAVQGTAGPAGAAGAQGQPGPQGPQGPGGPAGPPGAAGATGPAGSIGPVGPQGVQGIAGPPGTSGGVSLIQQKAALLQWYRQDLAVGSGPAAIAFDGTNIWIANQGSNNVTELRASDGSVVGIFPAGVSPAGIAFDGANFWVTNGDGKVTKLRASDGFKIGTFPLATGDPFVHPSGIAFDGTNIWVTSSIALWKLRASDGAVLLAAPVTSQGIAFDGTHIWVTNNSTPTSTIVTEVGLDGNPFVAFPVGDSPRRIAFDGANMWVTNENDGNVTKLRALDGANLGTFPVGLTPQGIAFDGVNIWVANNGSNTVSKF